ncbi:unnamed protein product [Amoebophrya sp. A25]|nr:unnamed protein product [Amoebophrya sp. A25]|eukprot:GSA25T00017707001.1
MDKPELLNLSSPAQLQVFLYGNYCPVYGQRGPAIYNERDRNLKIPHKKEFTVETITEESLEWAGIEVASHEISLAVDADFEDKDHEHEVGVVEDTRATSCPGSSATTINSHSTSQTSTGKKNSPASVSIEASGESTTSAVASTSTGSSSTSSRSTTSAPTSSVLEDDTAAPVTAEVVPKTAVPKASTTTSEEQGKKETSSPRLGPPEQETKTKSKKQKRTFVVCGLGLRPPRRDKDSIGPGGWPKTCRVALERIREMCANHHYESYRVKVPLIDNIIKAKQARAMLTYFIKPLKALAESGRIHPSLMLDTSTGRLACRAPNLQNQPALDKDVYQVRKSVRAGTGNCLVVCDFSQLELRVFAHETNCESMLQKFQSGGDFHSETAAEMYPEEIGLKIQRGELSLDDVKQQFGEKRKAAKTMNFGIAYGRSAFSIGKELDISSREAEDVISSWYRSKPEVIEWKRRIEWEMRKHEKTASLFGRHRLLPHIKHHEVKHRMHSERAGINHKIQGSAADIVMLAMLKLRSNEKLKNWGFRLILQIHDEVILEGPKEYGEEALDIVKECMSKPFPEDEKFKFRTELVVDGKVGDTWYDCK